MIVIESKIKILFIGLIILITAVFSYLFIKAKEVSMEITPKSSQQSIEIMENEYQDEMNNIYYELSLMLESGNPDAQTLNQIKEKLLKATVPKKKYQDMHMTIFLTVSKFIEKGDNLDASEIEKAKKDLAGIKAENAWITNN